MRLGEFSEAELRERLAGGNLRIRTRPFVVRIASDLPEVAGSTRFLYQDFELADESTFADFHIAVTRDGGLRRWLRPQARFSVDGQEAFLPLPASHAPVMIEWGLNWCVVAHAHEYLIIHAAVVERDGRALIMPAPPGSGKSTLCAALVHRGWRLLSDELALVDIEHGVVYGMARPLNLKNRSLDLMREFAPEAQLIPPIPGTTKGTLALMRPPPGTVERAGEPARPGWVLLPQYQADAAPELTPLARTECFMALAEQTYNYNIHGLRGFQGLGRLLSHSRCHRFTFSDLDAAVAVLNERLPADPG